MDNLEKKQEMTKAMKLIISILIITMLFLVYGIYINSTAEARENKIVSELEEEYKVKFKTPEFVSSGEKVIFNKIVCDGSVLCPTIKDKTTRIYKYNIESEDELYFFSATYEDGPLKDEIEYKYIMKKFGEYNLEKLSKYIIREIGGSGDSYEYNHWPMQGYKRNSDVLIKINKNLDDELTEEYIENKLKPIFSYIDELRKEHEGISLTVTIEFNDNKQLCFWNYDEVLPLIRERKGQPTHTSDIEEIESYSVYEYMESLENLGE